MCKNCKKEAVYKLISGEPLCKNCFIKYFEKKVLKTIRIFKLIDKEDYIGVAISGGKDSLTVLNILNLVAQKHRKLKLIAILIDEGIKGYREKTIVDAKKFCKENNIPLKIYSYKKEFGFTLDQIIKKTKEKPCSICGVLRRNLLNTKARELKVKKLATGHNLDDEAQAVMMNQLRRNIEVSARLGPITGVKEDKRFIRRIKPLYLMLEKEIMIYSFIKGFVGELTECPYERESYRSAVRDMLNNFEEKYPGSKNSIITSFLEILPLLKTKYKQKKEIKSCLECKEPSSQEICQKCKILKKL